MVFPCKEPRGILDPEQFALSSRYSHGLMPSTRRGVTAHREETRNAKGRLYGEPEPTRSRAVYNKLLFTFLHGGQRRPRACWVEHGDSDSDAVETGGRERRGNAKASFLSRRTSATNSTRTRS